LLDNIVAMGPRIMVFAGFSIGKALDAKVIIDATRFCA
jgi:hypothetical protein